MRSVFVLSAGVVLLFSCKNAEIADGKDVTPETISYDYKITGEEESENVTVMLQYRFGGENGTTLILDSPSKVTLDNKALSLDSAALSGAFYETALPAAEFRGSHKIVFTDKDGKAHEEVFEYKPITLAADVPQKLSRDSFELKFAGHGEDLKKIRLVMTDTAFGTTDFNEDLRIKNGIVKIKPAYWRNLKSGPITLDIYQEAELPLKNGSKEGGRFSITYSLQRQFTLVD